MPKINNNSPANANLAMEQQRANNAPDRGEKFGKVLSGVATVALKTTATVAPLVPGGVIVGKAAEGVQKPGLQHAVHAAAAGDPGGQPQLLDHVQPAQGQA